MLLTLSRGAELTSPLVAVSEHRAAVIRPADGDHPIDGRLPGRPGTAGQVRPPVDIVEEWGVQSFPASDPPSNW